MGAGKRPPDEALVVRCGHPRFEAPVPLCERCDHHEGVYGFSVQSAGQVTFEQLAAWCPNKKVGVTTVGEIRALGYDVIVTTGQGYHATVVVREGWDHGASQGLIRLFREETNPIPRKPR